MMCVMYSFAYETSTSSLLKPNKSSLQQGDPYDSSDEEWDLEMVRCTHHPPIFDGHTLDAGVDMVNLVGRGFAPDGNEEFIHV